MFAVFTYSMVPCRHWKLKEFFLVVITARDNIKLPLLLVTKKLGMFLNPKEIFYYSILKV